jgi:vacuolar-type H+-ATPase subunit I/STV1
MTDQFDEPGGDSPEPQVDTATMTHADLGARISGVIKAAEELAEQIRSDAHDEAARIRRDGETAAVATIQKAEQDGALVRSNADEYAADVRATGESYASEHRRAAESEVAKLLSEADAQARHLREAAEEMSSRIEAAALRRRDEIEERTRVVESKLRRFQAGLAAIAQDVEELLEPRQQKPETETLTEALAVDKRTNQQPD